MVNKEKRCGCGGSCSCSFATGDGVSVVENADGSFTITQGQGNTSITVADSISLDFVLSGAGTTADPYIVRMDKLAGAPNPGLAMNVQDFFVSGTWFKPFVDGWCEIAVWGGGGGGGGSSTSPRAPGYGGGGGGCSRRVYRLDQLPDMVAVTVGLGGGGGAGAPDSSSAGQIGVQGGASAFGGWLYAGGGFAGSPSSMGFGGYGTELGGIGSGAPSSSAYADIHNAQNTGTSGAGGGGGGYVSTVALGTGDGAPGGFVYGAGFLFAGQGGLFVSETPPTPGFPPASFIDTGGTGGGGGHGGGEGRSRTPGAAGGAGGGGGGGAGGGSSSGQSGGPGGDGRVHVYSWQATI